MGKRVFAEEGVKLEAHAERFGKLLFRRFPQWRRYATYEMEGEPDDPIYHLKVEVTSPNPALTAPLIIHATADHVTIGLGRIIHEWYRPESDRYLSDILPFLDDIIAERVVFLFKKSGNEPMKFVTWRTIPPPSDSIRHIREGVAAKGNTTYQEYSWRGLHDKVTEGE
jgi:hypothetical protein